MLNTIVTELMSDQYNTHLNLQTSLYIYRFWLKDEHIYWWTASLVVYEDMYATSKYQGHGKVITSRI